MTYAVGSSYSEGQASPLSGNQLGVVVGNSLINTLNPQSTASSLGYTILGQTLTLNLLIDTGSGTTTDTANVTVYYESSSSSSSTSLNNINPYDVSSSSFTPGGVTVLGTATVTEVEDSSLTLIDSGFITNTTNPAMGYVLTSGDFNKDGLSDVAVGNRGYTDINGNVLNGTIQILFGGQDVLTNSGTNPLTPTDLSGNPNGLLITGIEDGGQANSDYPLSMKRGDVNGDDYEDLIIGAPNVNNQQGAVYVIYGSSSLANQIIDVTNLQANQGYVINAPSGVVAGDLFGYAVTVGNFNSNGKLDIAIGTPDANNGNGSIYVAYDGSSSVGSTPVYNGSSGEGAGFALATSHHVSGGAATFSGSTTTDDLIIGAPNYQLTVNNSWNGVSGLPSQNQGNFADSSSISAGAVYVFTSSITGIEASPSYTYIGTDLNTPSSNGAAQDLFAGSAVVSNGDWDGDGYLDLAISSPGTNSNDGAIYLVKGNPGNQTSSQALNTISNLIINGGLPYGQAGTVITSAGDINDDGYEDFLITAPQGANGTGQGYVLFGSSSFLGEAGTTFELNVTSSDSKTTFLLNGNFPYQLTGAAASPIGDINNDGVDDLMLSAPSAGQLYAVYGHPWLADDGSIKLANISGDNGFVIDGDLYSFINADFPTITNTNAETFKATPPILITNQDTVYLGYWNDDIFLQTSQDNGQTWNDPITSVSSSSGPNSSPGLAFYKGILYLAYQQQETGGGLYITSSADNGTTWTTPYQIGSFGIEYAPSLVVYQDQLLAIFVSPTSSSDIQYVYGSANVSSPLTSQDWSGVYTVANPGSASYPNQTASGYVSATAFNDALYLAYTGGTSGNADGNSYVTSTTGTQLTNLTWEVTPLGNLGIGNSNSLSITADKTTLYLGYANTSEEIQYLTSTDGTDWSSAVTVPNQLTSYGTTLTTLDGGGLLIGYTSLFLFETELIKVTSNLVALTGTGSNVVMLGDINGDGFADVLAGGSPYGAVVTFGASTQDLLDAAVGTDELVVTVANGGLIQTVVAAGDFNGDGLGDFGVLDQNDNFYLVLGKPDLGPQQTLALSTSANIHQTNTTSVVAVGDYDGDGYDDLLLTVNGEQQLYKGNSSGALDDSVIFTANSNTTFNGIGDVNGDGYADTGGGAPTGNQISPVSAIANGQGSVYLGNASASSDSSSSLNPPTALLENALNNDDWGFYSSDASNNNPTLSGQQTSHAPSFAVFNGYLYMLYNSSDDQTLYLQRSADGYNWEGLTNLGSGFETYTQASLAIFQGTLYLAFTSTDSKVILAPGIDDSASSLEISFSSSNFFQVDGQTANSGPTLGLAEKVKKQEEGINL